MDLARRSLVNSPKRCDFCTSNDLKSPQNHLESFLLSSRKRLPCAQTPLCGPTLPVLTILVATHVLSRSITATMICLKSLKFRIT
jgi:hypothetical protein